MITEEELNSLLNNLDLKFIAQKLKIEKVDKSIITLIKIVKSLQQENKQLKEELKNKFNAQQKIDKALKYIDEFTGYYADDDGTAMFVIEELKEETFVKGLLQILGDKENE